MVKLLWNTANNSSFDLNPIETPNFKWKGNIWGEYLKNNSDKWIFTLLEKIKISKIESLSEINSGDEIIIVDSNIERKFDFYSKLNILCSKIFLFHLGDEIGLSAVQKIYDICHFSWRIFCTNLFFKKNNVSCIPLGYKSDVYEKKSEKIYKWVFTGTVHKSSRQDLLYQLTKIKPHFVHKTEKFAEKKSLDAEEMSKILSSSQFVPCPNGVVHPETYRLYEALECNCIPIVEKTYNYYDRLFPNNPFLKVDKWIEAKEIILDFTNEQIERKRNDCKKWWELNKKFIQNNIFKKISNESK